MPTFTNFIYSIFDDAEPKFEPKRCVFMVHQRERCPDTGTLHWQGYAEFKRDSRPATIHKAFGTTRGRFFNRDGTQQECITYVTKEDTRVSEPKSYGVQKVDKAGKKRDRIEYAEGVYREAHAMGEYDDAMAHIRNALPINYNQSYHSIAGALGYKKRFIQTILPRPFAWRVPVALTDWLRNEATKVERAKCLVLVGDSQLGKTAWAQSLGRHIYWRRTIDFTAWDKDAKFIIIDDIWWGHIKGKKTLLTQMGDLTVNEKYAKKLRICVNKPAIICTNRMPEYRDEIDARYWAKNSTIVEITEELFDRTQKQLNLDTLQQVEGEVRRSSMPALEDEMCAAIRALSATGETETI